ncbi:hypothetical protein ACUHMQ_19475 [Chitinimonas sp. PSY-7]|uniref:hypothetical protein n=1 Tax=Chitinimonas sp. PSY-7 TaxID=3459088 RepID=UPI0040403418
MRVLNELEVMAIAGSEGRTASEATGVGGALGAAVGVSRASSAGASWTGRALAGTVGGMAGAGLTSAAFLGWDIGTAINDKYGKEIGDFIWESTQGISGSSGGNSGGTFTVSGGHGNKGTKKWQDLET